MNCSDIKNKLPQYLAGECSMEDKLEISKHISTCPDCRQALEELEEPIFNNSGSHKLQDTGRMLNKARKALILKVITTILASLIILVGIFCAAIPGILRSVRYPAVPDITRSLVDITQFTSPSQVGGYGNTLASFGEYSFNVSAYTCDVTGIKIKNSAEVTRSFDMVTGTYQSPAPHLSQFVHPDVKVSDEFLSERTSAAANKILTRNGDTTVAAVDISLKSVLNLEETAAVLKGLDLKVVWMAVECGGEGTRPTNMSSGQNQYIQWGVPGKLYSPNNPNTIEFSNSNVSDYSKSIIEELKWLDAHKKYISADKSLLKFQRLDNSVGSRAKYIIDNGLKVYGLRITGPSSELCKLQDILDIRLEEVKDIDFYYWN
ncbi:MAG: anti sigma factor C-terminal domain-containing protein [Bacillota bacterium]|nr:anti sigma factor C-terminal domain-containing protein [Bacillota bacterium]